MINIEEVIGVLKTINDVSKSDEKKCVVLANAFLSPFENKSFSAGEEKLINYFLATKINLALCTGNDESLSSFSAGDIRITHNKADKLASAKALYDLAHENVVDIIGDNGFAFLEV